MGQWILPEEKPEGKVLTWGPGPIRYAADTSKCIDIAGGKIYEGAKLQIRDCNGLPQQSWGIIGMANGRIWSSENCKGCKYSSAFVVDIPGCSMQNGNYLHIWSEQQSVFDCQNWWVEGTTSVSDFNATLI